MNEAQRAQCRQTFEKYQVAHGYSVQRDPDGHYKFIGAEWCIWQEVWPLAYAAGAADENEACAILCENAENCSGELLHHDCHEQDAKAIRAWQEQGKVKP